MTVESNLNVTRLPLGFKSAGINCGVRRYRPDLGLVYSEELAVAAGVFTVNECKAAPVVYSQKILPSAQIKAIITNSGQANAATGAEGIENNLRMAQTVAGELKCETHQVLTASTGVIGQQLSLLKIISAVPDLIKRSSDDADNFSLSILTTDLVPKTATKDITLSEGRIRITGVCKGSGMIHPNMATMLAYIFTDVSLSPEKAQFYLGKAVNLSFNRISVDGDCSTNDTVFLMANGAAGVKISSTKDEEVFFQSLVDVCQALAQKIAIDGEGATKLIEVHLKNSPTQELADKASRGVTISPLIKTAIHGEDPNWGRILARLGAEGVPSECIEKMQLRVQGILLFEKGTPVLFDREMVRQLLKKNKVIIEIDLFSGNYESKAWGCDLSKKYVEINTEYTT
ncbi:MAG: bifunctional glutamate N-acetyltransferase/amino-acid acetyltransferase ArgJ [Deltaproteobacteria bacterium]|jgi:glutamate N-acetyltransferase/amino-acid N-acetyltransferase|nr:bifunctional glutamate N-acetyltransferase/amino-acid acetyltransferase ArgJ [Deltaproteobacteria bacterium]